MCKIDINDIINQDGTLDIYAFMQSKSIREYMRNHVIYSPREKELIILKSFVPIDIKIQALKILVGETRGVDKDRIRRTVDFLEDILEEIYNPKWKSVYRATRHKALPPRQLRELFYWNYDNEKSYSSYKEFMNAMYSIRPSKKYKEMIDVDIVPAEHIDRMFCYISFEACIIGKKLEIISVSVDDDWAIMKGYSKEDSDRLSVFGELKIKSLPFYYGEKVIYKTPFMKEPLEGTMNGGMDACGTWYHWFCYKDEEGNLTEIDMQYLNIHAGGRYVSAFDWLESADKELTDYEKKEIYIKNCRNMSRISDLKPDAYGKILCKVKSAYKRKGGGVYVTLQDDSGEVEGIMRIARNDMRWIYDVINNRTNLLVDGHFVRKENGKLFMDFNCDVLYNINVPETPENKLKEG